MTLHIYGREWIQNSGRLQAIFLIFSVNRTQNLDRSVMEGRVRTMCSCNLWEYIYCPCPQKKRTPMGLQPIKLTLTRTDVLKTQRSLSDGPMIQIMLTSQPEYLKTPVNEITRMPWTQNLYGCFIHFCTCMFIKMSIRGRAPTIEDWQCSKDEMRNSIVIWINKNSQKLK